MLQIKKLIKSRESQFTFITTIISMIVVHYYTFANMLINHDSVNYFVNNESKEFVWGGGRWALYLMRRLSGEPTLIGVISLLCICSIAVAAVFIIDMFQIHNRLLIICTVIIIVTFPTIGNILCYIYGADGIMISICGGVFASWLFVSKERRMNLLAIVVLIFVCGIYQASWCMSVALVYLLILCRIIKGEIDIRVGYKKIVYYACLFFCSLILYIMINKILLSFWKIAGTSYAGLDNMLDFSGGIQHIIDIVYGANLNVLHFFLRDGNFIVNKYCIIINVALLVYMVYIFILHHKKMKFIEIIMIVIAAILAPSVMNCVAIASKGYFHAVMMMPFVFPYIMCISCAEVQTKNIGQGKMACVLKKLLILLIFILGYTNFLTCNKMYTRQQLNYEATYGYLNRMLMRIEENEVYQKNPDVPVCFVNNPPNGKEHVDILTQNYPEKLSVFNECDGMVGNNVHTMIKNTKDVYDFLENFLGTELTRTTAEENILIGNTKEFEQMPFYPESGSMQLIDGVLVIKLPNKIE